MKNNLQLTLDSLAIGISALCVLHCLALPLVLILLPTSAALPFEAHTLHQLLIWFALPTSVIAAFLGWRKHKNILVAVLSILGLAALFFAALYGHDILGETGEKLVTLLGATILAIAHFRNFSLCRNYSCSQKQDCNYC